LSNGGKRLEIYAGRTQIIPSEIEGHCLRTAKDNGRTGNSFRIKIWEIGGGMAYDNLFSSDHDAYDSTETDAPASYSLTTCCLNARLYLFIICLGFCPILIVSF
jgi:hypothetical protein